MQKIAAFGIVLALAAVSVPVTADEGRTTYSVILDSIIETYGFVPPTAIVNGVEVPAEDALALLKANAMAFSATEDIYTPPSDVGLGVKQGGGACLVAAILTSYAITFGAPAQALIDEDPAIGPGGTIACGSPGFAWNTGVAGAGVAPSSSFHFACLNTALAGSWVNNPDPCYVGGLTGANIAGRAGFVDITFSFFGIYYHIEQMFGGVQGWAPGAAGNNDAAVMSIA